MLTVKAESLELRGIANKTSNKGNIYYSLNCESSDGSSYALYCPSAEALPQGLKKGDMVNVLFDVTYFKGKERLVVRKVEKVSE